MRAVLNLELFGEDTRQLLKIYKGIFTACLGEEPGKEYFEKAIGPIPSRSSWVAEITGPDEKYWLKREFVKPKLDYSHANSKGSRGIFAEFLLDEGKVYEVKAQVSWKNCDRYFCIVTNDGDIQKINDEVACHSVGALTRNERESMMRVSISEIVGPDDTYILARNFLKCEYTYYQGEEEFNKPFPGYNLEAGKVYEIRERMERGEKNIYYCKIGDYGEVIMVDETSVYHSFGALTRDERREKRIAERVSRNQRP